LQYSLEEEWGKEAVRDYVQHLADDLKGKFSHLVEDFQALVDKTLACFGAGKPESSDR